MTPLHFEELYRAEWDELEALLDQLLRPKRRNLRAAAPVRGDRLAALYRRACEQLALARARAYPAYMVGRLDRLTSDAHQVIYQRRELAPERLLRLMTHDFPCAVRAQAPYVWLAAALLTVPTLVVGLLVYSRPDLVLAVVDAQTAAQFERMYSDAAPVIGSLESASSNWAMFGYYISHNIGIAFQCFAGGLFAGVGSLFFLAYNGVIFGTVGGYLTERGHAANFYSFVVTHGAFELTAIVLAGAAGLKLGHAWLSPGRYRRLQSLVIAAKECALMVYGVIAMLIVAAAIEAFWSSAAWLPHAAKYAVAAICWTAVLSYLGLQGRHAH